MVKKGLAMSGKLGSEPLGKFYTGKKPKKRREWRGFKDTWYDYVRWLGYWKTLITFIIKPNNTAGCLIILHCLILWTGIRKE